MELKPIFLKKGKDQSIRRYHQWIFSGALQQSPAYQDGELVEVFSHEKKSLGWGYFNNGSIAVKMLDFSSTNNTHQIIQKKIHRAFEVRKNIGLTDHPKTNCYRLVHGEGDGLPGLIIDYYNGFLVMQIHHIGITHFIETISNALQEIYGSAFQGLIKKWVDKKSSDKSFEYIIGSTPNTVVTENGIRMLADWEKGQKTGFFIDQRENRKLVGEYAKGKSVLNTFCYTGGFSLYAEKGGATSVHSVDYSQWAIDQLKENYALNDIPVHHDRLICGDALSFLQQHPLDFELIILDPPAFAKSINSRHNAIQAYKRINQLAIQKIKPGGILFTFSCSQVIDTHMFRQTVMSAAIDAGKTVRILQKLGQPADHPVQIFHPESEYLKGLILHIE